MGLAQPNNQHFAQPSLPNQRFGWAGWVGELILVGRLGWLGWEANFGWAVGLVGLGWYFWLGWKCEY
jgi:hypothetical protein